MASSAPLPELVDRVLARLALAPAVRPERVDAGRRRAASRPLDPAELAAAVLAEGRPLLRRP